MSNSCWLIRQQYIPKMLSSYNQKKCMLPHIYLKKKILNYSSWHCFNNAPARLKYFHRLFKQFMARDKFTDKPAKFVTEMYL